MKRISKADQFKADMARCRGMGWISLGMMVEVDGHLGTIVGMNGSANLDVVFVNQLKWGKGKHNCHPTWMTRYFDADGKVLRDFCGTNKPASQASLDEVTGAGKGEGDE